MYKVQRFSVVTDQMGMAILSVIPGNPLLWAILMENFNLGIAKCPLLPKIRYFRKPLYIICREKNCAAQKISGSILYLEFIL